ncbi:LPS assembly lipoprotein LptE [Stieleria marina]|uniref:Lipopolysaccharide-assembly n=1 Tax=Stieleria marina TaxID=1930275 RepID=A0A517NR32_9BACT|nr:hypothetical protein K239x_15110 [Planctomycetes bacterium K23_9]
MIKNRKIRLVLMCLLPIVAWLTSAGGCASYQYGNDALFPVGVTTVHVPIVQNDTYRHSLGPQLSEAIVKEIQDRTNYVVTGDPNADSTLRVRIVAESKRVLTEASTDDPRALDAAVSVRADWVSRNGQPLMQNSLIPMSDTAISFGQNIRFVPEAGQSVDTAMQQAIDQLAARIVSQMEMRW